MKRWLPIIVLPLLFIAGCAVTDTVFGRPATVGPDGRPVPGSDGVGGFVSLIPGLGVIGTAIGAIGTVYQKIRAKQWADAATSTITAVEEFKSTPQGEKVWDDLKDRLAKSHTKAKVKDKIDKVLGNTSKKVTRK